MSSLTASTVERDGRATLAHELPREQPTKRKPRPHGPQREARRAKAERRAVAKLKLLHLPEYQAIYAGELHAEGLKPTETVQFDTHLRKLAGARLLALTTRSNRAV